MLELHQNPLEGLLKLKLLGLVPGFLLFSSDWELGWGWRVLWGADLLFFCLLILYKATFLFFVSYSYLLLSLRSIRTSKRGLKTHSFIIICRSCVIGIRRHSWDELPSYCFLWRYRVRGEPESTVVGAGEVAGGERLLLASALLQLPVPAQAPWGRRELEVRL